MKKRIIASTTIFLVNFFTFASNAQTLHSIIISDKNDDDSVNLVSKELEEMANSNKYKFEKKLLIVNEDSEKDFIKILETTKVGNNDIVFLYMKSNLETVNNTNKYFPLINFKNNFYYISDIHKSLKKMDPRFLITLVDFNNEAKINEAASIIKPFGFDLKEDSNKEPISKLKGIFKNKGSFLLIGNNGEITEAFFKALKNKSDWKNVISKTSETYFSPFKMEIGKLWEMNFCEQKNSLYLCINSKNKSSNKNGNFELSYSINNPNIEKVSYNFSKKLDLKNRVNNNKESNFKETFNFKDTYLQELNTPSNNLKITLDLKGNNQYSFQRDIVKDLGYYMKKDVPQIIAEARKITEKDIASNPMLKKYQYVLDYSIDEDYTDNVKEVTFVLNEKFKYRIINNNKKDSSFKETLYFNDTMLNQFNSEDQNITLLVTYEDGSYNKVYRSVISDLGKIYNSGKE